MYHIYRNINCRNWFPRSAMQLRDPNRGEADLAVLCSLKVELNIHTGFHKYSLIFTLKSTAIFL